MIWCRGQIIAADDLRISCLDRTFEHGLGLFETLRTWEGRARLLPRHIDRLRRSARTLGLPLEEDQIPDTMAVASLLDRLKVGGDARLRIVLTGGLDSERGSTLWMRAQLIAGMSTSAGLRVRSTWTVASPPVLEAYKSLNYWRIRRLHEEAVRAGFDEDIGRNPSGAFLEGTRANLFAVKDGEIHTPAPSDEFLPGIFRGLVIEVAGGLGMPVREVMGGLSRELVETAEELWLTNSGRGLMPVEVLEHSIEGEPTRREYAGERGAIATAVQAQLRRWLIEG